jgi:hypothetical protein
MGVVAAVVIAGLLGTGLLVVLMRRSTDTVDGPPDRPPVTMRSPQMGDLGQPLETVPAEPAVPAALQPAAPPSSYAPPASLERTTLPPPPRVAETRPAETTLPAPPVVTAPPATEPPAPARAVTAPNMAAFPGAGVVSSGEKFFEKTLVYSTDQLLPFGGHVGPLKVSGVQFAVAEKTGRDAGIKSSVRAVLPLDCPKGAGEWDFKFQMLLLDENGRAVDRLEESGSCENEIKTVRAERSVIKALVPTIRGVKVRFQAEKD